eukprot:gene2718-3375_t
MASKVWTFIPNLIGYARVIFAVLAFYYCYNDYMKFFIFYAISGLLDMADGHAARMFNQCSQFGALLDMITDRCSTIALIIVLSHFYPQYLNVFISLIVLDVISHFARLYSTLITGSKSHKATSVNHLKIMRIYYDNKYFLAFMCFGNEAFFLWSYLYNFFPETFVLYLIWGCFFPISLGKQIINVIQFFQAITDIVELDDKNIKSSQKSK